MNTNLKSLCSFTLFTLLALTVGLAVVPASRVQAQVQSTTTVTVTHRDGSVHTFLIPVDMETTFDLVRAVRNKERSTGEFVEAALLDVYNGAVIQPQFQPPALKSEVDAATAAVVAKVDAARTAAKNGMRPSGEVKAPEPAKSAKP